LTKHEKCQLKKGSSNIQSSMLSYNCGRHKKISPCQITLSACQKKITKKLLLLSSTSKDAYKGLLSPNIILIFFLKPISCFKNLKTDFVNFICWLKISPSFSPTVSKPNRLPPQKIIFCVIKTSPTNNKKSHTSTKNKKN